MNGHIPRSESANRVAVIIPVFNRRETTLRCLAALAKLSWSDANASIVVVDDGSTDGTGDTIRQSFPDVVVLQGDGGLWWTGAINLGLKYAVENNFDFVLLLNDDLEFSPDFFSVLWLSSKKYPCALVSSIKLSKVMDDDVVVTADFHSSGFLREIQNPHLGMRYREISDVDMIECDLLTGASLLIPVSVIRQIGWMDDARFPHNWGDFEYTLRASQQGYRCFVATRSMIYCDMDNPNYHYRFFVESTRKEYLVHLFDNHRYNYGFGRILAMAFMHRPWYLAVLLYTRRLFGLLRSTAIKLVMPQRFIEQRYKRTNV